MPAVALAAPSEAAAAAGERVASQGGSAVDVAIAAALVSTVNEVGIVSLSSGAFVTVQPPEGGPAVTIDGWMDMPGRRRELGGGTWDVHTEYGGGVTITVGPGSVAVHGAVAAFGEAHARWGRVPWADVVAPAVEEARTGFVLGSASRYYLDYVHDDIFGWDPVSRAAVHDGDAVSARPIVVPGLADALEHLGEQGASSMYAGDLGRAIARDVVERGGILGTDDLDAYAPVTRPALATRVGEWMLATNPPPSVGGVSVAAMLRLLDGRPRGGWSDDDVELMVRVQRAVLGHRRRVLDTTDHLEAEARAYLDLVDRDHLAALESGSTAHVSVVDSDGGACSLTLSSGYGSGMVARGTGIWLNNCLGEQELNARGLHGLPPGSRLLSNMAPTVGRSDDGATLAIGSPGADRISTAVAQALAGFTGGMDLASAVAHPRVHVHRAGSQDEDVKRETSPTMYFGGVIAALRHADGTLDATTDPRRDGATRLLP